jgi:predicted RNase H-related nuclease YkuK (DUF458 family)
MAKKNKAITKAKKRVRKVYQDPYSFEPVSDWIWREYEGKDKVDPIEFITEHKERLFFVGTDSQGYSKSRVCVFTSVIIAYDYDRINGTGHGATIIRHTDRRAIIPKEALSAKLTVETQRSIEICKMIEEQLIELSDNDNDYMGNLVGVSIDCNYDEVRGKSARYKDMLVGMVLAYGWKAFIKPDSFAATTVADSKC